MADIKFEIRETVGVLFEGSKGWKKDLNLINRNDKEAKYDIREWDTEHVKIDKGVTLTEEEFEKLIDVLSNIDILYCFKEKAFQIRLSPFSI